MNVNGMISVTCRAKFIFISTGLRFGKIQSSISFYSDFLFNIECQIVGKKVNSIIYTLMQNMLRKDWESFQSANIQKAVTFKKSTLLIRDNRQK